MFDRLKALYARNRTWTPVAFFVMGFTFDACVLHRIDELAVLIQQAIYLLICGALIGVEFIERERPFQFQGRFARAWEYREAALHFLMGTLLNSYTIFYFKSASSLTSILFIIGLVIGLTFLEFKHFGPIQSRIHLGFWSLSVISYFTALIPILLASIGPVPFLIALGCTVGVLTLFSRLMKPKLSLNPTQYRRELTYSMATPLVLFTVLYFLNIIPPVPLSMHYMGIFHSVEKDEDEYKLLSRANNWKFWQSGDQTFYARPGDVVHCFASIFSPARFSEQLQVRWLYQDARSDWQTADVIPLTVSGGREEGFRTVLRKSNFQPGQWRVQVETTDSREVGRIRFEVIPDEETGPRTFKIERR